MTVCIAARAGNHIVLVSDRMITQDNMQFEPARQKINALTNSIFIMTSGDASFLNKVIGRLFLKVREELKNSPEVWLTVSKIVEWYVESFSSIRSAEAQVAVLLPFGLTTDQFMARQVTLDTHFVERVTTSLLDYRVPSCDVIIAGCDPDGSHIYSVDGTKVDQHDTIGFAAVGVGARHAISYLMQVRHAWNSSLNDAVVRAFVAKRRAEVAPGVGRSTDAVIVGDSLGEHVLVSEEVLGKLDVEFERMVTAERTAEETARRAIEEYISSLGNKPAEPQEIDKATVVDQEGSP